MRLQDAFLARHQIVCIVFHEGGTLRILHARRHDLHQANHCRGLPVALAAKAISFFHQTLDSKSRKLLQRAKIAEVRNDRLIVFLLQEFFKTDLDACLHRYMLPEFLRISALQDDVVFAVVFLNQRVDLVLRYRRHIFCDLVHRISVDLPAKFDLRLYLIALRHGNISHIVCDTAHADVAALHDTDRRQHP